MNQPKVSILVPIFGVEQFIEKCARSLFEQTFTDIEYIFVNDCTSDQSMSVLNQIIKDYPQIHNQIKIVTHTINMGIAETRNTAIDHAHGKFILFVDSDDYLEKNAVELLFKKAVNEKADIVTSNFLWQFKTYSVPFIHKFNSNKLKYIKSVITNDTSPGVAGKLIKTSLFKNNKLRAPNGCNYGEDYYLYSKLVFFAHKIAHLSGTTYHYVQYNDLSYVKNFNQTQLQSLIRVIYELKLFYANTEYRDELIDDFRLTKLKAKYKLIWFIGKYDDKNTIFPKLSLNKYRRRLSSMEYIVLKLADHNLLGAIRGLKYLLKVARRIKRIIKS